MTGHWEGSDRKSRLPPDWESRIVPRILRRDRGICHVCLLPGADAVDHVVPGDDHRDANLAAIHSDPCHAVKSSREGTEALQRRRAARFRAPEPHPGVIP